LQQSPLSNIQQSIRFCPGQVNPRALSEHNFAFHLAKLARQNGTESSIAYQIFLRGILQDQEKNIVISNFLSVVNCIKRGLVGHPNRDELFRAYRESGGNINDAGLSDKNKKLMIEKTIDTISECIRKLSFYNVPVVALIDFPYRKAPAGFKTSAFLSVESFLVRNLGLSLVDIILAVKKSEC